MLTFYNAKGEACSMQVKSTTVYIVSVRYLERMGPVGSSELRRRLMKRILTLIVLMRRIG